METEKRTQQVRFNSMLKKNIKSYRSVSERVEKFV